MTKVGVYICTCSAVRDVIDVDKLAEEVKKIEGVEVVKFIRSCYELDEVIKDLQEKRVERVVIAGCSPRYVLEIARERITSAVPDISPLWIEVAPIREHAAWAFRDDKQRAFEAALTYIKAYVARVKVAPHIPKEREVERVRRVLIIGGGIAGLTAAVDVADMGIEAVVVEKRPYVGGKVVQLARYFPKLCPPYCGIEFILGRLRARANPLIKIYTNAQVLEISGSPGRFKARIRINPRYVDPERCTACGKCSEVCPAEAPNEFDFGLSKRKAIYLPHELAWPYAHVVDPNACLEIKNPGSCGKCLEVCSTGAINLKEQPREVEVEAASVIVATGWEPYDATRLEHLGYGKYPGVVTNVQMERILAPNGPTKGELLVPGTGKKPKKIVFIQCAGQRDENHLPYCSAICCAATLKQAITIAERNPDVQIYIFYIDIRAFGLYELFYKEASKYPNIFFIRGRAWRVEQDPATGELVVHAEDTILGRKVVARADMVVLAVGMVPSLRYEPPAWYKSGVGRSWEQELLKIPRHQYFVESDYICFPMETKRTGVYACGCAMWPMDVQTAVSTAHGAAMRATSIVLGKARTEYSYLTDPNLITIDTIKCTQCKRCTEECPFDVYSFDERGYPKPDPLKCRRCGICVGACPAVALSLPYHNTDLVMSMIKSVEIKSDKTQIIVFACLNDAYPSLDIALKKGGRMPPEVELVIPVPCIGSVNMRWIADTLSLGIDGILLLGCRSGEAEAKQQCHFIRGPDLERTRIENLRETLQKMMIEPERVKLVEVTLEDYNKVIDVIKDFVEFIKKIGLNPMKQFAGGGYFGGGYTF